MQEAVLGIDIGTSGVRIVARSIDGAMLAMAAAPLPKSEGSLQDPASWWKAVAIAFAALNLQGIKILAVAIDGTSGTILSIDGDGRPVDLTSMYNDVADPAHVTRIKQAAPPETAAHGATSPLARAIARQVGARRILHQADWLIGKFCGRFDVSDENNALKSGYDPVKRQWPSWLADVGMMASLFPDVVPAGTRVGTILPDVAKAFGLPHDVAVVAGTTDGCAGFLASGASLPGDGATSLGTTLTLKLLSATPVFSPAYGIYSHRIGDQWLAGGASNSGGVVLAQAFSKDEIIRLSVLIDPAVETGLNYYPLPKAGERFPVNDSKLEPRMTPRPLRDEIYLQGLLEGIAEIEALGYRRLAELGASPLVSIRSAGGGAGNDTWTAIRLRKLKVTALPSASEHAAMGTARLAWRGIGHDA